MNSNYSNFLDMRNLQEQVKKAICYQKLFWSFTVWKNCSSDGENRLKFEAEGRDFAKLLRSLVPDKLEQLEFNFEKINGI